MTTTLRAAAPLTSSATSAPNVRSADAPEPPVGVAEPRANYVAIYTSSIFAVTMLFLLGVGVPSWLFLDDAVAGFGLGAMCAVWGGPSFGVMAASARVSAWHEANHVDF